MSYDYKTFTDLLGLTFVTVERGEATIGYGGGNDCIRFTTEDGRVFELTHYQSCCENVYIESVVGDLSDLEGAEILLAEEASKDGSEDRDEDSYGDYSSTWTFYKLATSKGYVDIRFFGSSNGYYGESADLYEVTR